MPETATRTRAFSFGKHQGKMVNDPSIPLDYLTWWLDTIDATRYSNELRSEILAEIKARRSRLPFEHSSSTQPMPKGARPNFSDFDMYSSNATGRGVSPPPEWNELKAEREKLATERQVFEAEKRRFMEERKRASTPQPPSASCPPAPKLPTGITITDILAVVSAGRQGLAKRLHPDVGGSHEQMQKANMASDWLESFVRRMLGGGK